MRKRLLALLVTALVLCTMAVTIFADTTSEWITTQTYVEIPLGSAGIDSTEGLTISVTISTPNGTLDTPIGARAYAYYSTPVTEEWQYFGGVQVESWDETYVFHNFTITLPPYNPAPNAVVGIDISDIIPLLNNGIRWRYTIVQSGTEISGSYDEGYNAGYTAGDSAGYDRGYTAGDSAGYDRGYTAGDSAGYERGFDDGITIGGNNGTYQEGYNAGYTAGDNAGYNRGYSEGYSLGYEDGVDDVDPEGLYQKGFAEGKAQGQDDAQIVDIAINGFFDSLTGFIEPFTSIGIGSITIGAMLTFMVTVAVILIVVKVVRG